MDTFAKGIFVCAFVIALSTAASEQILKVRVFGEDETLLSSLHRIFYFLQPIEELYSCAFSLVLATAAVLGYYIYKLIFVPVNRIRRLEDDGYSSDGKLSKKEVVNNVRRRRDVGTVPPVYPNGWFGLIESFNLKRGEAKPIAALGLNLAIFRDEKGEAHVLDAYCPHLGAHIGVGGRVVGDCLQCPFHGWEFRGSDGKVTKIPYADKVPEIAKTKSWPSMERNGWLLLWYHAEGADPTWLPSEVEDITKRRWTYGGRTESYMNCHISDMLENAADRTHLEYVHPPSSLVDILSLSVNKLFNRQLLEIKFDWSWDQSPAPEEHIGISTFLQSRSIFGKDVKSLKNFINMIQIGPSIVHGEVAGMLVIMNLMPVEPLVIKLVANVYKHWAIPNIVARAVLLTFMDELMKDAPIFNAKRHCQKPLFVKSQDDGNLAAYRRYYSQFYSENSPRLNSQKNSLDW